MPDKRRLALSLVILIALGGCATQKVHVTVKDRDTGAPVEEANVTLAYDHNPPFFIAPHNVVAVTDGQGRADLTGPRGGWLVVDKVGYDSQGAVWAVPQDDEVEQAVTIHMK